MSDPAPKRSPPLPALPALPQPQPDGVGARLLPGFTSSDIETDGATIRVRTAGDGPPVLLLHGHPETHLCWHRVAPALLGAGFRVVLADLRGYGDSSKPPHTPDSRHYAPRAMAEDMVSVMAQLGHRRFRAAGHDRGGRVLHRLCLDHPEAVERVAVLDIAPTLAMYEGTTQEFATRYVWWFLQIQPAPFPEHVIGLDPAFYLREHLERQSGTAGAVTEAVLAEYLRCYACEGTIRAVCEDYRAAAGIGLALDRADRARGHRIGVPLLALWGAKATVGRLWDVLATWRACSDAPVTGEALPCGHLLPEERPDLVADRLIGFFR